WLSVAREEEVGASSLDPYRGRPEALAHTLKNYVQHGFLCAFGTDQPNRARTVLAKVKIHPEEILPTGWAAGAFLAQGNLAGGFALPEHKLAFITDSELFGVGRLKLPQRRFLEGAPIATVLDLKPGDYVVHIHFGIGVFRGLATREVDGIAKEFLRLDYSPPDKLFVPADQLDRVQKYLNPGDETPKVNRPATLVRARYPLAGGDGRHVSLGGDPRAASGDPRRQRRSRVEHAYG
ncbi:MAG: hypothetical protein HY248_03445, partial [Fimbriimonas ginsengisoli]|nr:hypothetical protein [Fimbriimonas ginsengisoli]